MNARARFWKRLSGFRPSGWRPGDEHAPFLRVALLAAAMFCIAFRDAATPVETSALSALGSMAIPFAVAAVIVTSSARLLRGWTRKALALLIFLVVPGSAEIQPDPTGLTSCAAVGAVLVLLGARTATGTARRIHQLLFAVFCSLCPLAFTLLPALVWLVRRAGSAYRVHLAILGGVMAMQAVACLAGSHGGPVARAMWPELATLGHWLASKTVWLPLLGWPSADAWAAVALGLDGAAYQVLGVFSAGGIALGLVALVAGGQRDETTGVLLCVWLCAVAAIALLGPGDLRLSISPVLAERTTRLPNTLMLWLCMHQIEVSGLRNARFLPLVASGLLALALFHSILQFAH